MAALVREFPRVPAIALLTETETSTPYSTLLLGQLGIKRMVDARTPLGWQTLRSLPEAGRRRWNGAFNQLVLLYQTAVYNVALRTTGEPDPVLGSARAVVRRESLEDLVRCDLD